MPVPANLTIISGGQTGADRAALDFAIANGFAHGGWCPRHRRAEDGGIPICYFLQESPSSHYAPRTKLNVRDSRGTRVVTMKSRLPGGTRLTFEIAKGLGKPVLQLNRDENDIESAARELIAFLDIHQVGVLNVAGPRASQEPEIGPFVQSVLAAAFAVGR